MKIILDLDTGIDDALALSYALGDPMAEVIGVTCTYGNVFREQALENTETLLKALGRTDIPIYAGPAHPLTQTDFAPTAMCRVVHGEQGFGQAQIEPDPDLVQPQPAVEFSRIHLTQHLSAEIGRDLTHFRRHQTIFVRQVGVILARIDQAQRDLTVIKIKINLFHQHILRILEINGHKVADGTSHLIEQSARLAEIHVLGVLTDLGNFLRGNLSVIIQMRQNRADQHFKSSGGRNPRTFQHRAVGNGLKSADLVAALDKSGQHAADQCFRRIFFFRMDKQIR